LQDPALHCDLVIEQRTRRQIEDRTCAAALGIGTGEHQAFDTGRHARTCAHDTRFFRDVQRGVLQTPSLLPRGSLPKRDDLGMCGRIVIRLFLIEADGSDLTADRQHRSDRHIAACARDLRQFERPAHQRGVVDGASPYLV